MILLNNQNIENFGVKVLKVTGNFDMPKRMSETDYNWKGENGTEAWVETSEINPTWRKIYLDCLMDAVDYQTLSFNLGLFRTEIYKEFSLQTEYTTHARCLLKEEGRVKFLGEKFKNRIRIQFTLVISEISYEYPNLVVIENPNISNNVFWIDNVNLADFGVVVEQSEGFLDFPKMKNTALTKYQREQDAENTREPRTITLQCSLMSNHITPFKGKLELLQSLLIKEGLRKLMIPIPGLSKPFEVFFTSGLYFRNFVANENQYLAQFTLQFVEPNPQIESFLLLCLLDTDGVPILTTDGDCILVVADLDDFKKPTKYVWLAEELAEITYIWTTEELDTLSGDYNPNAKEVYLFTDAEIEI